MKYIIIMLMPFIMNSAQIVLDDYYSKTRLHIRTNRNTMHIMYLTGNKLCKKTHCIKKSRNLSLQSYNNTA